MNEMFNYDNYEPEFVRLFLDSKIRRLEKEILNSDSNYTLFLEEVLTSFVDLSIGDSICNMSDELKQSYDLDLLTHEDTIIARKFGYWNKNLRELPSVKNLKEFVKSYV